MGFKEQAVLVLFVFMLVAAGFAIFYDFDESALASDVEASRPFAVGETVLTCKGRRSGAAQVFVVCEVVVVDHVGLNYLVEYTASCGGLFRGSRASVPEERLLTIDDTEYAWDDFGRGYLGCSR